MTSKKLEDLHKLADEAQSRGMWLRTHYQDIWQSPKEWREQWQKGKFLWSPDAFEIVNPEDLALDIKRKILDLETELRGVYKRIEDADS